MQKKILTAAVSAVLLNVVSVQAVELDLSGPTPNSFSYVESLLDANSSTVTSGADCEIAVTKIVYGVNSSAGADRHIRIELVGGTFGDTAPTGIGAAPVSLEVAAVAGGNEGDNFVVFQVDTLGVVYTVTQTLSLDLAKVVFDDGSSSIDILYSVHVEADNAANDVGVLFSKDFPDSLVKADGASFTVNDALSLEIDPTNDINFVGSATLTDLSKIELAVDPAGVCTNAGSAAAIDADEKLEVSGDFSALFENGGKVSIDPDADGSCDTLTDADPITATLATFSGVDFASNDDVDICVTVDGVTSLAAGSYDCTLTYSLSGGTDIELDPVSCGSLAFAGSSDRVAFGLTPGGAYKQYFRISNPSTTDGEVTVTLTNDDGESASFPLGSVTNIKGALEATEMPAGSSTDLLFVDDLYAAAQASVPAFEHNDGKMRVIVRGNFGDDATVGTSSTVGATTTTLSQTLGDGNTTDGIILEAVAVGNNGEIVIME